MEDKAIDERVKKFTEVRTLDGRVFIVCHEALMEPNWDEGFFCTLERGHSGPHRDEGDPLTVNESVDIHGRRYRWVHEWRYETYGDA